MHFNIYSLLWISLTTIPVTLGAVNGKCSSGNGVCVSTASCTKAGGTYVDSKCPSDPGDIKCCNKSKCETNDGNVGSCMFVSECTGTTYAGLCPGGNDFKCCVTNPVTTNTETISNNNNNNNSNSNSNNNDNNNNNSASTNINSDKNVNNDSEPTTSNNNNNNNNNNDIINNNNKDNGITSNNNNNTKNNNNNNKPGNKNTILIIIIIIGVVVLLILIILGLYLKKNKNKKNSEYADPSIEITNSIIINNSSAPPPTVYTNITPNAPHISSIVPITNMPISTDIVNAHIMDKKNNTKLDDDLLPRYEDVVHESLHSTKRLPHS